MGLRKEGNLVIPISFLLVGGLYALLSYLIPLLAVQLLLAVVAIVFLILVVRFFRDPIRECPMQDGVIYAPADGKIVVIEETTETEYLGERRIQLSIFMSPLNVHVNRSPVTGIVDYFKYHKGKYLVAWHPKSSTLNERTTAVFRTADDQRILMRQIAGAVARRIFFYPKVDENVKSGESVGFIRFGSRVDLFLPLNATILVRIGDRPIGGVTELAKLN